MKTEDIWHPVQIWGWKHCCRFSKHKSNTSPEPYWVMANHYKNETSISDTAKNGFGWWDEDTVKWETKPTQIMWLPFNVPYCPLSNSSACGQNQKDVWGAHFYHIAQFLSSDNLVHMEDFDPKK